MVVLLTLDLARTAAIRCDMATTFLIISKRSLFSLYNIKYCSSYPLMTNRSINLKKNIEWISINFCLENQPLKQINNKTMLDNFVKEGALIKKKIKFSSYIRKFRRDQLQSHIWLTVSLYIVKYLRISSYFRKPFLIYDFATDPIWISYIWGKFFFLFYQFGKVK